VIRLIYVNFIGKEAKVEIINLKDKYERKI